MPEDYVEVYQRSRSKPPTYEWRRIDGSNGQVIATSGGQGYAERTFAIKMAARCNPGLQIRLPDPKGGYTLAATDDDGPEQ